MNTTATTKANPLTTFFKEVKTAFGEVARDLREAGIGIPKAKSGNKSVGGTSLQNRKVTIPQLNAKTILEQIHNGSDPGVVRVREFLKRCIDDKVASGCPPAERAKRQDRILIHTARALIDEGLIGDAQKLAQYAANKNRFNLGCAIHCVRSDCHEAVSGFAVAYNSEDNIYESLAIEASKRGDFEKARKYAKAISKDESKVLPKLTGIAAQQGNYAEAEAFIAKAYGHKPSDGKSISYCVAARHAAQNKDYAKAIEFAEKAYGKFKEDPTNVQLLKQILEIIAIACDNIEDDNDKREMIKLYMDHGFLKIIIDLPKQGDFTPHTIPEHANHLIKEFGSLARRIAAHSKDSMILKDWAVKLIELSLLTHNDQRLASLEMITSAVLTGHIACGNHEEVSNTLSTYEKLINIHTEEGEIKNESVKQHYRKMVSTAVIEYCKMGEYDRARGLAKENQLHDKDLKVRMLFAIGNRGDFAEATKMLDTVILSEEKKQQVCINLGAKAMAHGEIDHALNFIRNSGMNQNDLRIIYNDLLFICIKKEQYEKGDEIKALRSELNK